MDNDYNKKRIESINRMIMEMTSGNFAYKIERSDRNDELEALVVLVNMMAEEMKASFRNEGVNLNNTFKHIVQMTFVLDERLHIQSFSPRVAEILLFDAHELEGKPFADFLTDESREAWEEIKPHLIGNEKYDGTVKLFFKTKETFIVPAFCSVCMLFDQEKHGPRILITALETILENEEAEKELSQAVINYNKKKDKIEGNTVKDPKARPILREQDKSKIREVHDYILQHLGEPILSLKDLAHEHGTNEYKLKHGFKELYGITVFRFLMDERLKKANFLIRQTDIPLKEIAESLGFKSFPHFSKSFKNRFGYRPSDLKKQSRDQ